MDRFRDSPMNKMTSAIWSEKIPQGVKEQLQDFFRSADASDGLQVFFRADDIAIVDEPFRKLMKLFLSHQIPLCLAVVPDWLDKVNWEAMQEFDQNSSLWCWHQHGRSHSNHERHGKKCEFGDSRTWESISKDLVEGRLALVKTMGDLFYPVFTPPWNRCGSKTLKLLRDMQFRAISRSEGARPAAGDILPDLSVNVDLHTRRENDMNEGWQNLVGEFSDAAASGRMGIMLHHQMMNNNAFSFLDMLLFEIRSSKNISSCTFRDLL